MLQISCEWVHDEFGFMQLELHCDRFSGFFLEGYVREIRRQVAVITHDCADFVEVSAERLYFHFIKQNRAAQQQRDAD